MMRRSGRLCALALVLFILLPVAAGARPVVVRKLVKLTLRTAAPTFAASDALGLVDRGRRLVYGTGITREHETIYLLRLGNLGSETVRVPLKAYVRGNPGIMLKEGDRRPVHEQFWIRKLLFYEIGRAHV